MRSFESVDRSKAPIKFEFRSGSAMEPCSDVMRANYHTIVFVADGCLYEQQKMLINRADTELWELFWKGLAKGKVTKLKRYYNPKHPVLDGGSWSFDFIWEEGGELKRIQSSGQNAGPFKDRVDHDGWCSFEDLVGRAFMKEIEERERFERLRDSYGSNEA